MKGISALFGSDSKPEPEPLNLYAAPESVNLEAGLQSDRSFSQIGYSQSGIARPVPSSQRQSAPIQITVNAIDSRSFMDHSEDIARAVREAMLQSHSLNDVIAEI